jgi:hypothetical protein
MNTATVAKGIINSIKQIGIFVVKRHIVLNMSVRMKGEIRNENSKSIR